MDVWGKLNLRDQTEIVVANAPPSFEPEIKALGRVTVKRKAADAKQIAFFIAFVTTRKEVEALAKVVAARTLPDAVVWFAYPKATSKSTRARSAVTPGTRRSAQPASSRCAWWRSTTTGRRSGSGAPSSSRR